MCTTVSAATVNSIAYTACKNFYYHNEDKKYYATVDAALSTGCIECTSASDVAIGADVNAVSGGCTAISNINTKCGTYNFL